MRAVRLPRFPDRLQSRGSVLAEHRDAPFEVHLRTSPRPCGQWIRSMAALENAAAPRRRVLGDPHAAPRTVLLVQPHHRVRRTTSSRRATDHIGWSGYPIRTGRLHGRWRVSPSGACNDRKPKGDHPRSRCRLATARGTLVRFVVHLGRAARGPRSHEHASGPSQMGSVDSRQQLHLASRGRRPTEKEGKRMRSRRARVVTEA
jgi:hypothetical protein